MRFKNAKIGVLEITDKIVFSGSIPAIQVKGAVKNPLKIQIIDNEGIATHEFIVNSTGAGDIRHDGKLRRIV